MLNSVNYCLAIPSIAYLLTVVFVPRSDSIPALLQAEQDEEERLHHGQTACLHVLQGGNDSPHHHGPLREGDSRVLRLPCGQSQGLPLLGPVHPRECKHVAGVLESGGKTLSMLSTHYISLDSATVREYKLGRTLFSRVDFQTAIGITFIPNISQPNTNSCVTLSNLSRTLTSIL